eukprot:m51a1_g10511 hypothetical protein (491) ;mRNA; f:184594-186322
MLGGLTLSEDMEPEKRAAKYNDLANAAFRTAPRMWDQAITWYTAAIKENLPDKTKTSTYYCNRAAIQFKRENYGYVLEDCNEAIKLDPGNVKAYWRAARAHLKLGRPPQALALLDRCLNNAPADADLSEVRKLRLECAEAASTRSPLLARIPSRLRILRGDAVRALREHSSDTHVVGASCRPVDALAAALVPASVSPCWLGVLSALLSLGLLAATALAAGGPRASSLSPGGVASASAVAASAALALLQTAHSRRTRAASAASQYTSYVLDSLAAALATASAVLYSGTASSLAVAAALPLLPGSLALFACSSPSKRVASLFCVALPAGIASGFLYPRAFEYVACGLAALGVAAMWRCTARGARRPLAYHLAAKALCSAVLAAALWRCRPSPTSSAALLVLISTAANAHGSCAFVLGRMCGRAGPTLTAQHALVLALAGLAWAGAVSTAGLWLLPALAAASAVACAVFAAQSCFEVAQELFTNPFWFSAASK